MKAADYDIKSVRADFFPSLSTGYATSELISEQSKGPTETDYLDQSIRQFNLKLTQLLYSGHRLSNNFDKARMNKKVVEAEAFMDQLELVYNIEITFYRLMKAKQDVIATSQAVERLAEGVRSAQAFFDGQLVPYVDVLQAQVDLADAIENLGIAKNNVNRERVALFALMNQPEDPGMGFVDDADTSPMTTVIPEFSASLQQARENRPDLESLSLQRQMAEKMQPSLWEDICHRFAWMRHTMTRTGIMMPWVRRDLPNSTGISGTVTGRWGSIFPGSFSTAAGPGMRSKST